MPITSKIPPATAISSSDQRRFAGAATSSDSVSIGGKKAAAIALVGDALKGLIPMLACHALEASPLIFALTGIAAFLGHLYPVFFGFKGGKGVATALGVQFGLSWLVGASVAGVWLFMAKVLNVSSLAALVSMTLAPLFVWIFWPAPELIVMQSVMSLILIWRHRSNIRNLLSGEEGKISKEIKE